MISILSLSKYNISHNGQATIATSMQPGSVAIVKIGDKSVKVLMT